MGGSTTSSTSSATVADAPLTATSVSLTGTEGTAISGATVATFTDANPNATVSDFTATIDWGDGTTSAGTIVAQSGGGFAVDGAHTYADEGEYTVGVSINDAGGSTASATSKATIADIAIANGSSYDTITLGDGAGDTVSANGSSHDTITLGHGAHDSVSANSSNHDKINLGDGAGNSVSAYGSYDTISLGNGAGDNVGANGSSYDAITLGDGAGDTVAANGSSHDTITLGHGAHDPSLTLRARGRLRNPHKICFWGVRSSKM